MGASEECFSDIHYIDITSGQPLMNFRKRLGITFNPVSVSSVYV